MRINLLAAFIILATLTTPYLASAAGRTGDACTGSGQGTCDYGYNCMVAGPGYNTCQLISVPPNSGGVSAGAGSGSVNPTYLQFYKDLILTGVNDYLVPVLIAIAFIVFLWGIYKAFIWNGASESEKAEGRHFALWGIIGFVIIVSVWGLVRLVQDTIIPSGVQNTRPNYPTL